MAGAGYKLFNTGDVLTAAQVNTYLMEQTVMVFANAAARTTALSGVVSEGMISYLKDTNAVEVYDGSNWVSSDDPNAIQNTIVDAKGDLIAATANDTPARLAVGNNGETLVADSSATTGLRWQSNFAAGKNKVINGDFGIWQRGTSSTSNGFLADRFNLNTDIASFTQSRQAFTPGTAPVAGYEGKFFYRFALTTLGAGTYWYLNHYIEDVQTLAGQTITFSFWAKADSARNVSLGINQNFGSGGSSVVATDLGTKTLSTSWTRYTSTVSLPSISGKTVGTGSYIQPYFAIAPSAGMTIDIWGVQLEAGNTATAFQTATGTLAGELAACQRYYSKSYMQTDAPATVTSAGAISGKVSSNTVANSEQYGSVFLPVAMRTNPTVTIYSYNGATSKVSDPASGTDFAANSGNASWIGQNSFMVINNSGGTLTTTRFSVLLHYVASAEL